MGSLLSKIQNVPLNGYTSNLHNIAKLWLKSRYFSVAIVMITFLIARRVYNHCHRIYYNLALEGRSGLPLIGCLPLLLVNTYKFVQDMSIATYNLGWHTITVSNHSQISKSLDLQSLAHAHEPHAIGLDNHNSTDAKWKQRRKYIEQIIRDQLNSKMITKCIKNYIDEHVHFNHNNNNNESNGNNKEEIYVQQRLKLLMFNILMICCFGISMDAANIDDEFYSQWDSITHQIRDAALDQPILRTLCGDTLYGILQRLSPYKSKSLRTKYMELWHDMFAQCVEEHIQSNEDIVNNPDTIYYKLRHRHHFHYSQINLLHNNNKDDDEQEQVIEDEEEDELVIADLFVIMANAMDTTSSALEWCILSLCQYPSIQSKLYDEVCTASKGNVSNINLDLCFTKQISLLKAFIHDNLRLYPLGSMARSRQNSTGKPMKISLSNGKIFCIPPNGLYHMNMYAMTRMHENWRRPTLKSDEGEFDEQEHDETVDIDMNAINLQLWLDEHGNFVINDAVSAFGFGVSNCIGKAFAIKMLQLVLAMLLFRYEFTFNQKQMNDLDQERNTTQSGNTCMLQTPLIAVSATKRLHSHSLQALAADYQAGISLLQQAPTTPYQETEQFEIPPATKKPIELTPRTPLPERGDATTLSFTDAEHDFAEHSSKQRNEEQNSTEKEDKFQSTTPAIKARTNEEKEEQYEEKMEDVRTTTLKGMKLAHHTKGVVVVETAKKKSTLPIAHKLHLHLTDTLRVQSTPKTQQEAKRKQEETEKTEEVVNLKQKEETKDEEELSSVERKGSNDTDSLHTPKAVEPETSAVSSSVETPVNHDVAELNDMVKTTLPIVDQEDAEEEEEKTADIDRRSNKRNENEVIGDEKEEDENDDEPVSPKRKDQTKDIVEAQNKEYNRELCDYFLKLDQLKKHREEKVNHKRGECEGVSTVKTAVKDDECRVFGTCDVGTAAWDSISYKTPPPENALFL